jgi:6-phosphogluconolactonase (cycloisomerase 2 family)
VLSLLCVSLLLAACARREAPASEAGPVSGTMRAPESSHRLRVVVLSSAREQLHVWRLQRDTGELVHVARVALPEQVHYAVADAGARFLYVSVSDGKARHWVYAFRIDPASGALSEHGAPLVPSAGRVIHLSIDPAGKHLVLAHNQTSTVSSVRLNSDGTLGEIVAQPTPVEVGFFAHQALFDRSGAHVIVPGLGAAASDSAPERPGSLAVFGFDAGRLTRTQSIELEPGFGARHLDYGAAHVYVAVERGNRLRAYGYAQGALQPRPSVDVSTLPGPSEEPLRQRAGAIHLHPNGKALYLTNRANQTTRVSTPEGETEVFLGGINDIAFYRLDAGSGEPRLIERYDTQGFEPRTFSIEPAGEFSFVGNQSARNVRRADGTIEAVPRSIAVFRIQTDGRLAYQRKYDISEGDVFWVGSLALPQH